MASLIQGWKGYLILQFRYRGLLCREYLGRRDTRDERRALAGFVREVSNEIRAGNFEYAKRFPDSRMLARLNLTSNQPATMSVFARRWLRIQSLGPSAARDYEYLFRTFLDRTVLGGMMSNEIIPQDLRDVIAGKSVRRSTMFLQRMRAIFAWAIEEGVCEKNPAQRVKNPRVRERTKLIEGFSPVERKAILDAAEGRTATTLR